MIEVLSSIEIDAPAEDVWKTLTDLPRFHAWNPFIRAASGSTRVGESVHVRVRPSIPVPLAFDAKVVVCDENRALRWRGSFVWEWLASGDHTFSLEPAGPGRVSFVQREVFTGILPYLARRLLVREARKGFDAMNRALKTRAENAS